jgi:Tol biopolymer transport system component
MVYTATNPESGYQIWRYDFSTTAAIPVLGAEMGMSPSLSPDGREVAFIAGQTLPLELRTVRLDGGAPRTLADSVCCFAFWGEDGFIYFNDVAFRVMRIPATGGSAEPVAPLSDELLAVSPYLAPGGRLLFYTVGKLTDPEYFEARALDLTSGEETIIQFPFPVTKVQVLRSGHILGADRQGRLWVAPFNLSALELTGPPVLLAQGLETVPQNGGVKFAASGSSVLVYELAGAASSQVLPIWVDRTGNQVPVDPDWTFDPGPDNLGFALSPDGSKVAAGVSPDGTANLDIWVKQLPRGPFSRLTSNPREESRPRWTPDGHAVTYISPSSASLTDFDLYVQRADGFDSGAELLADEESNVLEAALSRDGAWLVMRTGNFWEDREIVVKDLLGDSLVTTPSDPGSWQTAPALSPDGGWLAYQSDETGRSEIYVRSFPDLARKRQISSAGGHSPVWGRKGRELFFVNGARELVAVEVTLGQGFEAGDQTPLFQMGSEILSSGFHFSSLFEVDQDDQRFLMLRSIGGPGRPQLVVALNWLEEAEAQLSEGGQNN